MAEFIVFKLASDGRSVAINPEHVVYCVPDIENEGHTRIICNDQEAALVVDTSFERVVDRLPPERRDQHGRYVA